MKVCVPDTWARQTRSAEGTSIFLEQKKMLSRILVLYERGDSIKKIHVLHFRIQGASLITINLYVKKESV